MPRVLFLAKPLFFLLELGRNVCKSGGATSVHAANKNGDHELGIDPATGNVYSTSKDDEGHYSKSNNVASAESVITNVSYSWDEEAFHHVQQPDTSSPPLECGIWLAPSAIPGSGLGMFAGKDFKKGDLLQDVGDLCIPIIDFAQHNMGEEFKFLWDEYTWSASALGAENEGFHEVNGASPGFGSAANSFLPVVNVDELYPRRDTVGLHRSKDPGAGAFTHYYDRGSAAERDIAAGEEFYVSYGESWFKHRTFLGPIPLENDLDRATLLFKTFHGLKTRLSKTVSASVFDDLWNSFVVKNPYKESRVLGGFHHDDPTEMEQLENGKSVSQIRTDEAKRTQEWLREHGTCGDHLRAGPSTLEQAGHGAFASRKLPEGTVIAQLPLIHVTNRSRFNMYHFADDGNDEPNQPSVEAGQRPPQLLLNYCYGHRDSTLLLCPYGPMVNYINHNQTRANAKLVWGDPKRGNFIPHLLERSLSELETDATAKLAFELVATRDIAQDEEVFIDYGQEWEYAWQMHVDSWKPVEGAEEFRNADELNEALRKGEIPLYTEFEYLKNDNLPRSPVNVELTCNNYFSDDLWRSEFENGTLDEELEEYEKSAEFLYCTILRKRPHAATGEIMYTVEARNDADDEHYLWKDCPASMFRFLDKPYTTDMFLLNAFRHDIRIPDELFPRAWRNLAPGYNETEFSKLVEDKNVGDDGEQKKAKDGN